MQRWRWGQPRGGAPFGAPRNAMRARRIAGACVDARARARGGAGHVARPGWPQYVKRVPGLAAMHEAGARGATIAIRIFQAPKREFWAPESRIFGLY